MPHLPRLLAVLALAIAWQSGARADHATAEESNKSNNPLNPAPAFNVQDYYAPDLYGSDRHTNDLYLRGATPLPPMGFVPVPQLIRATVPVSTRPEPGGGNTTGLGDLNVFDIFLLRTEGTQLGIGPLLTMPTASEDELGTGKWQGGLAAIGIHPTPQYLIGGLLQWQKSFAGDDDRADVESFTAQPFFIYNLPKGWYLRSTAIWTFDLENSRHYIPVGAGGGKVWKMGTTIVNAFIEPQWTVDHDGEGWPKFAIFGGLNFTFGK